MGRSGRMFGYTVEARVNGPAPREIDGEWLDARWRRTYFPSSNKTGVPRSNDVDQPILRVVDMLSYYAAEALRWWLVAIADREGVVGFETRIVKHQIDFSITAEREGVVELSAQTGAEAEQWKRAN